MTTTTATNSYYGNLGLTTDKDLQAKANSKKELGQEDFLTLMTTQLQNQDPFKPMDSGDFLGQMAQFGTVSGIEGLKKSFDSFGSSIFSNQALQASSMIGRTAYVPSDALVLPSEGGAQAMINVPGPADNMAVTITDSNGDIVAEQPLGKQPKGVIDFQWDGLVTKGKNEGQHAEPGKYTIKVNAVINNKAEALATYAGTTIDSVNLDRSTGAATYNLAGLGAVKFNDITQIR